MGRRGELPRQLVLAGFSADQDEPDARSPRIHLFGSPTDRMARHDGGVRAGGALLAEARSKSRARLVRKICASIVRKLTMPTVPDGTPSGAADEDDFDRRLRELTEGSGPEVRFWEPSAAERARTGVTGVTGVKPGGRRPARKARKFRGPRRGPARRVRAAYAATRQLLIAAGLNQATLRGGRPVVFAGLLTAQERKTFLAGLNHSGLDRRGFSRSTRGWVASFAPGQAALAGPVIKVRGHLRGRSAVVSGRGVLQVHADYLFVYPVTQPGLPATLTRIVFRFAVNVDFARWDDPGGRLEPFWEFAGGGAAGARCGISDGFIHPDFRPGAPQAVEPSGAPVNPYDQQIPPDSHPGCRSITGT
jgi:hypothetical protein